MKKLTVQRRIAARLLKCGTHRVWFDASRLGEVKEAITKNDMRGLIKDWVVQKRPETGVSKGRARKHLAQKRKGRRQGPGSREGSQYARLPRKERWIARIRIQREFLKALKSKKIIDAGVFRSLYTKAKGGFFRSRRHIKLYLEEHHALTDHENKKQEVQRSAEEKTAGEN